MHPLAPGPAPTLRLPSWRKKRLYGLIAVIPLMAALQSCDAGPSSPSTPASDQVTEAGTPEGAGQAAGGSPQPAEVSKDGAEKRPTPTLALTSTEPSPEALPVGAAVVYVDAQGLWLLDRSGPRLLQEGVTTTKLLPSADGRWVAYPRPNTERQSDSVRIVSTETGRTVVDLAVADLPGVADGATGTPDVLQQVEWNPAGDRLVLSTAKLVGAPNPRPRRLDDLWSIDPVTGAAELLLRSGQGGTFTFSPDGTMIALTVASGAGGVAETLAVAAADGTARRELMRYPGLSAEQDPGISCQPTWSEDGRSLLVTVLPESTTIRSLPAATGELRRVWLDGRQEVLGPVPGLALHFRAGYGLRSSPDGRLVGTGLPSEPSPTAIETPPQKADAIDLPRPDLLVVGQVEEVCSAGWAGSAVIDRGYHTWLESWSPAGRRFLYSMQRDAEDPEGGALHVGRIGDAPQRIVGNWRLAMPHWLSDDVLLLVLREDRPWLVAATVDGQLTVVGRIDPGADAGARAIVAVVPVPAD